ncbi:MULTISPECIES: hypothetical protein [Kitasatospora]|uniref:hypothetical protein n=1 Tax=Kitasatospora TaxID=2063 RepID=UPI000C70D2BE|nr:hypothetical protein [Kitasatospora sp. GP30]MDH6141922.1 hypothetical protein [Kitasatospora sp. GP30]
MTDNATEYAVDARDAMDDPEDLESGSDEQPTPRAELSLDAAADVADAVEQTRQVPVDDDEYPR